MRKSKSIPIVLALLVGLPFLYWGSWKFWYEHQPPPADPFAPQTTLDKIYTPIRDYEAANLKRKIRRQARES